MYKLAMITRSYQNTTVNVFVVSEVDDDMSELNLWSLFYYCSVVVASFDAVLVHLGHVWDGKCVSMGYGIYSSIIHTQSVGPVLLFLQDRLRMPTQN